MVLGAVLAAAPEETGKLTFNNVRDTHGLMGPKRLTDKILPGDEFYLCFDVEGVTIGADGKVHYSVAVEVADPKGKMLLKQEPKNLDAPASLGGKRIPAFVHLNVGLQSQPGAYTVNVTVVDLPTKHSQALKRTVEVLPKGFGIVRVKATSDSEGQTPVSVLGAGEGLWLTVGAVGFARGGADKQPDLSFEMRVSRRGRQARARQAGRRPSQQGRARRRGPRARAVFPVAEPIRQVHGRTDRRGQGRGQDDPAEIAASRRRAEMTTNVEESFLREITYENHL